MSQESWKLFGIELDGAAAEKARCISGASIFVGDVAAAPFPPESFDVITCFDVLEHVYSPRQVLIKVKELLKPGGIFFAVLPNIESWEARIFGSYWYGLELPRHISHFSPQSLRHIMNALGFKELTVFTSATTYWSAARATCAPQYRKKWGSRGPPWLSVRGRTFFHEPCASQFECRSLNHSANWHPLPARERASMRYFSKSRAARMPDSRL